MNELPTSAHSRGRGNPDFAKSHGLRIGQRLGPRVRGDERVERRVPLIGCDGTQPPLSLVRPRRKYLSTGTKEEYVRWIYGVCLCRQAAGTTDGEASFEASPSES